MLDDPIIGSEVLAALTPVIAKSPRTIDQILRREAHQMIMLYKVGALNSASRAKRPATAANALIFDRCDRAKYSPVKGAR